MYQIKKIAILLTCHNRKGKTINCLKSLYKAAGFSNASIRFDIFLVDDGSTDGTSEEIAALYPDINLIKGSGNLFWAGGMRLAWETALSRNEDYDAFLLLNDDVVLMENFLQSLLHTHLYCLKQFHQPGIYVSSTIDLETQKISYGGVVVDKKGIRVKKSNIKPGDVPVSCNMTNANILLVTKFVVNSIGILDPNYTHQFADYDYSLAASRLGIPVLVCPGIGGACINDHGKSWLSPKSTLKQRIDYLHSPVGLAYKEQLYYLKKNFRLQFPYYFIMLWLKTLFPTFWEKLKKDDH
ncbi:MAG TPA: glycosyltransferase family 2 protein [Paludibacter sp.]|nr:glycosyltransferase family 2 protein [Paludibacter sp.]